MFEYFPTNYTWNLGLNSVFSCGGNISEIEEACRPLKEAAVEGGPTAQEAWYESWMKVASTVERLAGEDERAGNKLGAGRKYQRACVYYISAERMMPHSDARKALAYKRVLAAFRKGIELRGEPMEWVDAPYADGPLPAIFVPAAGEGPAPCMICFDGLDVMKETLYFRVRNDFRLRGVSVLFVDHPGVGEALRLRELYARHDSEVPAAACIDYLEGRADVDSGRIGMMANSLGGYYAPRAAAFEKRLKCCVAWGAFWSYEFTMKNRKKGTGSVPGIEAHRMWVAGKDTFEEAIEVFQKFTLEGVAGRITCPLLIVHGENDRQVGLAQAEMTYDAAVNSPKRELKVFSLADTGAEHCQVDNTDMFVDYAAHWVAETLGAQA